MQLMKIIHIKGTPIYDVFTDEGWYNWTRILKKDNFIKILAGNVLTPATLILLKQYNNHA